MSPPVDPSWLPSTVAQSTAALVGIIGGLLVARFVSIDAEQKSLRARRDEAEERLKFVTVVRDGLQVARRRQDAVEVLSRRKSIELLVRRGDRVPSPAEFLDFIGEGGWSPEEFEPYLDEAHAVLSDCVGKVLETVKAEMGTESRWQPVRRKLDIAEDEWDALRQQLHDHLKKAWKTEVKRREAEERVRREREAEAKRLADNPLAISMASSFGKMPLSIPHITTVVPTLPRSSVDTTARTAEVQRMRAADDDVLRAQFEYDLAVRALDEAALPSSLMAAVWMLIGLTAIGLVLPIVALSAMPSYGNESWRLTVLVGFCVGITGLLAYLYITARKLRPRDDVDPRPHTSERV